MPNRFAKLGDAFKEKKKTAPKTDAAPKAPSKKKDAEPEPSPIIHRRGKRADSSYVQVSAYIPKRLHLEVKKLLIDQQDLDFSELIHQLLLEWATKQGVNVLE